MTTLKSFTNLLKGKMSNSFTILSRFILWIKQWNSVVQIGFIVPPYLFQLAEESLLHCWRFVFIKLTTSVTLVALFTSGFNLFARHLFCKAYNEWILFQYYLCNHSAWVFFSNQDSYSISATVIQHNHQIIVFNARNYVETTSLTVQLNALWKISFSGTSLLGENI